MTTLVARLIWAPLSAAIVAGPAMASCLESAASNVPFVEGQSCEDAAASAQPLADETVVRVLHPVSIAFPDRPRRAAIGSRRVQGAGARALPHGIDPAVAAVGEAYRIDPRLLHAVVSRESRFRPDAVSPKGALGLMQIMPATARDLGITDPTLLTRDPLLNLVTGARYLKLMQARFGNDLPKVLAAYNAGPGAVARHGGVPPYAETRGYVRAILGDYRHKLGQTSQ